MSDDIKDDDYEVGYGKPPKSTQFKKGQSGNRNGRRKGAKGVQANLRRELEAKITVQENNRTVRITKAEALAKRLTTAALKGDMKAILALIRLDPDLFGCVTAQGDADDAETGRQPAPVDFEILRDFLSQSHEDGDDSSPSHKEKQHD
ncbi:MAG: DUF5681 domain-containing protein [Tateyamaria sp.]|jgi:hypothetical protein|uniref:DUF5681 domain-containing protein n=1 Tax=Tateyamaria sp. TaxID=1929288 RepID=UPI0032DDBAD3